MKSHNKRKISLSVIVLATILYSVVFFGGCSENFLKPDPLSFFEPTVTFSTVSGLESALSSADKSLRSYWTYYTFIWDTNPLTTEYIFSEVNHFSRSANAVNDVSFDIATSLTPTEAQVNDYSPGGAYYGHIIGYLWQGTYNHIKYANTVLSFVDAVEGLDDATKNAYKGRAYFHRSFCYLNLVFQFGDVPLISKIVEVPKQNYSSTKKEAILEMITENMEFAVQWVPEQKDMTYIGAINKGACRMLLIKCYLATGQWQKAKEQADILIDQSGYALMQEPFGTWYGGGEPKTWPITRNVIWDMHRPENKLIAANSEVITGMVNQGTSAQSLIPYYTMRCYVPNWNYTGMLRSPDGKDGVVTYARNSPEYRDDLDYGRALGRGSGFLRWTYFAQHTLWDVNGVEDIEDLRHNSTVGNWARMDSIKYNEVTSSYRGQNLVKYHPETGELICNDTISVWFDYPHYKVFLLDVEAEGNMGSTQFYGASNGGNANWYLYRLAEAYLLRAEAKFYLGDATAINDVNEVRKRAKCSQLYTSNVTIGDIMNERARELFLEEFRNVELSRVSYCLALSGKPDEWGNTYDVNTFDKQSGTDANGGSYWYQRIMHYSDVYNKGPINTAGKTISWTMGKHNFYWPVPSSAITANNKGALSQNYGYDGYDPATPKWATWQEAVADEDKIN